MSKRRYSDAFTPKEAENDDGVTDQQTPEVPPKNVKDVGWMLINANLDRVVSRIAFNDIEQSTNKVSIKAGYELICSYTFKRTQGSTIYAPGTPSAFDARECAEVEGERPQDDKRVGEQNVPTAKKVRGVQLKPDTGHHWADQHAGRVPKYQFKPFFQALSVLNPDFRFNEVHVVVNRGTLQSLLKFMNNKSSQVFHLDLDMVVNTLFIGRRIKNAKVQSTANSYGRNFEAYFTTEDPELEGAEGHHRVLRYNFGGLIMVVRIEADAYIPKTEYNPNAPYVMHPVYASEPGPASGIAHQSLLQTKVIAKGTLIPHWLTMELKSNEKKMPLEQMWFGRTPACFIGRHKEGFFEAEVHHATEKDFGD